MTATRPARSSREAYRDLLAALLPADERLICLDSDTGLFTGVDFGAGAARYVNLGIAEQNLMGVAAGLAACGRTPFVNTMATFASTRALEAVKLDIALNNLPVRIVATHGGLSAGHLGPTHHSLEDVAIMRLLPNTTVIVPADATAAEQLIMQCLELPGPVYVRLGRTATPEIGRGDADDTGEPAPRIGRAQVLRRGRDVTLAACGPHPVLIALEAADELAALGVGATVVNLHTIKPLDVAAVVAAATGTTAIVTIEEHWSAGGLGAAVAEVVTERAPTRVLRVAVPDVFVAGTGGQAHLLERMGITRAAVVARALAALDASAPTQDADGPT
ncbi:MAG TPA: transketolase C-terminal domain-containing protein [Streptosporangiaceae bacterium]|jgi:transketolase|nr:transketolase C-terminal domain-containing protein [Streptosporangiaceae bacterium]